MAKWERTKFEVELSLRKFKWKLIEKKINQKALPDPQSSIFSFAFQRNISKLFNISFFV